MSSSKSKDGDSVQPKPSKRQVLFLLGTAGDTTWRMFIPILGLTILGVWADNSWQTKPWFTVLGIVTGTAIAALLVKRQFQKVI